MHSLFMLETTDFPECLLLLDSDKQLNQLCNLLNFSNFCASFVRKNMRKSFYLYLFLISYFIKPFLIASSQ